MLSIEKRVLNTILSLEYNFSVSISFRIILSRLNSDFLAKEWIYRRLVP
jgi:hypothetical protein